jgi:hypothetical protein
MNPPTPAAAVALAPLRKALIVITQHPSAFVAMCTPQQAMDPFAAALISALGLMHSFLSLPAVLETTSPHSIGTTSLPLGWVAHRAVSFLAA